MRNRMIVCGPGEVGPQCGYVSYMAFWEYAPKHVPMHKHLTPDGSGETVWGPLSKCVQSNTTVTQSTTGGVVE